MSLAIGSHVFTGDPGTRDAPGLCELCQKPVLDTIHFKHVISHHSANPRVRGRDVGLAILQFTSGLLISLGMNEDEIHEHMTVAMKGARAMQKDGPVRSAFDDLMRLASLAAEEKETR